MRATFLVFLLAACAADRPRLGEVRLRSYTQTTGSPETYSVQKGRILNPNVDLVVDADGCIRGSLRNGMVQLCSKSEKASPSEEGAVVEHWAGTGGDMTLEIFDHGNKLRMDGYLRAGQDSIPLQATVLVGQGPQWDELRKHPALLAIAAAISGVQGEPTEFQRPE